MEKITYHRLNPGEILDKLNIIDKATLSKYFKHFTPGAHEILFYAYDNEKKCVAGFCSCVLTRDYDIALLQDEMYIRNLNVFKDKENGKLYREQGIGTKLLKEVAKYAKENDYQRLTLMSSNEDSDLFYFGRGWVFYGFDSEMIKEVDDDIWLTACVMNECLNRTLSKKGKTRLGDEVLKMIKNKSYDNILGYLEEPLHDAKYNPTVDFILIDKKIQKLILNNKYIPQVIDELQSMIDSGRYHQKLKESYQQSGRRIKFSNSPEERKKCFVNNVCADVYLIEKDKQICKSRRATKEFFEKNTVTPSVKV